MPMPSTTMTGRTTARLALAMAATLALTSCGGGSPAMPDNREPLPLDALLEGIDGAEDERSADAQQTRIEELTATCMAEEGFDYIPVDYTQGGGNIYTAEDLDVEWGSREFAEKYGYGATTDPWGDIEDPGQWTDPNREAIEAMSEAEVIAFENALYGDQSIYEDWTEEDWANYEWVWEDNGCSGWATNEVLEGRTADPGSGFEQLWDEIETLPASAQGDPRLTDVLNDWTTCMAEAGYPGLVTLEDAQKEFYERLDAIWDEIYADVDLEDPGADHGALEKAYQDRIAELTDEEIATATAEWDCKDATGYADVEYEVLFELQEAFVAAHRTELEALVLEAGADRE